MEASPSDGFEFPLNLREGDQRDKAGLSLGDVNCDATSLAWSPKVFCVPKDQPEGVEQAFTLTVTSGDGTTEGRSAEFYIQKEATMDRKPDGPPEINAALVHKWWDPSAGIQVAPQSDDKTKGPLIMGGSSVNVYEHPSETTQVLRELREFPLSVSGRREFLKNLSVWQLVSGSCVSKEVATISGWFFDAEARRAGFCMPRLGRSLDEILSPNLLMRERFTKCDQVLQIMMTLQQKFPFLVFPDIKPKNFLCASQSSHASLVLTDLDDVRRVGSVVPTHTSVYRHEEWIDGARTKKVYEQHAVAVTLLQILLGMPSQVPPTLCISVPARRTRLRSCDASPRLHARRYCVCSSSISLVLRRRSGSLSRSWSHSAKSMMKASKACAITTPR